MYRVVFALTAISLMLVGVGCQSKEQAALDRARNRPAPGYLRVLNLTDKPVTLTDHTKRPMNNNIAPGKGGLMNPAGEGEKSFVIDIAGEKIDLKATIVSGEGHTAVVWPNKKVTVVSSEMRLPKDLDNLTVAFIDENGYVEGQKATVMSGNTKVDLSSETKRYSVSPGEFKSEDGSASIAIAPDFAYSFIFVKEGDKFKPYFMLNSDPSKPVAGGAG